MQKINFWRLFSSLWCAVFLLAIGCQAAVASTNNATGVAIYLRDGSKINGAVSPPDLAFEFQTAASGIVTAPLNQIARLDFARNGGTATCHLQNGETLKGIVQLTDFDLQTSLGTLTVPLNILRAIKVGRPVNTVRQTIVLGPQAWQALPYPGNTDWSGNQGVLSTIDKHGIHLNGQPVRSRKIFKLPLEIVCDFTLDEPLLHGGGEVVFMVAVPGAANDRLPTHMLQLQVTTLTAADQGDFLMAQYTGDLTTGVILDQPPCANVQVGVLNHLTINMTVNGWTVQLNDTPPVTQAFTAESSAAQINLWNFQPDSRWTVSHFTISESAP